MASVTVYTTDPCSFCARVKGLLASRGIAVLAINVDSKRDSAEAFLKANGVQMTVLLDPKQSVVQQYEPPRMPS